jgi:DNA gyrase subunit A
MGRATQGVTLISVGDGSRLSGVQKVVESAVDAAAEDAEDAEPLPPSAGLDADTDPGDA